jgi:hypothetical protein
MWKYVVGFVFIPLLQVCNLSELLSRVMTGQELKESELPDFVEGFCTPQ